MRPALCVGQCGQAPARTFVPPVPSPCATGGGLPEPAPLPVSSPELPDVPDGDGLGGTGSTADGFGVGFGRLDGCAETVGVGVGTTRTLGRGAGARGESAGGE